MSALSLFVLTRVYSITLIRIAEHHDSVGHITESFFISINNNPSEENGASHSQLAPGPQPSLIRPWVVSMGDKNKYRLLEGNCVHMSNLEDYIYIIKTHFLIFSCLSGLY